MMKKLSCFTLLAKINGQTIYILLTLALASGLAGCLDCSIIGECPDEDEGVVGEITYHQTGGIAGFSRTTSIKEENGSILLSYTDHSANQRKESPVSSEDLEQLWQALEENDVFALPTNQELLETVRDAFLFEVIVQRGERYNQFSVYAPDLLVGTGEPRYNAVMQELERFAESYLKNAQEFIIADMPITEVSVEILESFPLQIHLEVEGYLSDACTEHNETTQRREGNTVYVHITTKRPKDEACALMIKEISLHIPLEGGFLPGRYKIIVNDVQKDIEI